MRSCLKHLVILALTFATVVGAQAQTAAATPIYLSYEQRILVSYALLAQGQDEAAKAKILQRAQALKDKVLAQPTRKVNVRNFEEFLTLYRGEWPNTNSLDKDLQVIESSPRAILNYTSDSPRVQKKITDFIAAQNKGMLSLADVNLGNLGGYVHQIGKVVETQSPQTWSAFLMGLSDQAVGTKLDELNHIGEKIAQAGMGGEGDATLKILLQTLVGEYFARLGPDSKKQIISAFLGGDLRMNDMQKFEVMVQNSGPQLQKMLQVVARQGDLNPEMLEIFRTLESSVRSVPWVQVQEILSKEKGYTFTYFERKPLGVGTMAQVHRAKMLVNGQPQDVVVRFIKPGIDLRVQEDHRILIQVAALLDNNPEFRKTGAPLLSPMVDDITATVSAELDQNATIARQEKASPAYEKTVPFVTNDYKGDLHFHVPKIYPGPANSKLMVQEMVFGTKLDKAAEDFEMAIPDLKRVLIEQLAQVWLQEVVFGSGFYHSDMHQGNFLVRVGEPEIQVTILDYGMGGVLPENLQSQVLIVGAGLQLLDEKIIGRAFWQISDRSKNQVNEAAFKAAVTAKVLAIRAKKEPEIGMDQWTTWAIDQGLRLPYEFVNLNRGLVIISKLLQDSGSAETMTTLTEKLAVRNPRRTYQALKTDGGLSLFEIAKLGWTKNHVPDAGAAKPAVNAAKPSAAPAGAGARCQAVFL